MREKRQGQDTQLLDHVSYCTREETTASEEKVSLKHTTIKLERYQRQFLQGKNFIFSVSYRYQPSMVCKNNEVQSN